MSSKRVSQEDLHRIIDLCRSVEQSGVDPFEVDIKRALETLKKHLPGWSLLNELVLDTEALNQLASIIRLQGDWIRHRASDLYIDPVMIELKIRLSSPEKLGRDLLKSMRPIVQVEQLSPWRLREAMDYWNALPPLRERFRKPETDNRLRAGSVSFDELFRMKILSDVDFKSQMQELWQELITFQGEKPSVLYWDFVNTQSLEDTIVRAYLTSFLVSEGYANLDINPLEEEISLVARRSPRAPTSDSPSHSVAVSLDMNRGNR